MRLFGDVPLVARLPLMAAGLMIIMGLVASQFVLSSLSAMHARQVRELARGQVQGLSVALGPPTLRENVWEVFDILDRSVRSDAAVRTVRATVTDAEGQVLASSDPSEAPVGSDGSALIAGAQRISDISLVGGARLVTVVAPLSYQGRTVGSILTTLDLSDLVAERQTVRQLLLLSNGIATLVLAGAAYLLMRRELRPLATLSDHLSRANDDPQPISPAQAGGGREVARLVENYNRMAAAVTARAEAERRLAERERYVSLGRLASSLAHEINNPLGGMLNAVDTLRRFPDRRDVAARSLELLDRGLRHLRDVTRAALETHRSREDDAPLRLEDFDDLRQLVEPDAMRRQQQLDWSVEPDAGETALPAAPVRQIALNLLLNAATAAAEGGHICFSARGGDDGLRLCVCDDGPGLDEALRDRLLTDDPTPPGSGMGLRLVRELVSRLDGRVSLERTDGITRVTVVLPAPASEQAA
ncbi:sensor histidine kinase [Rhodobacteraceae bacterium WD3A24]|nr:sensor histidine kinase [Rhodobacteraceae bacterium WD3A24]